MPVYGGPKIIENNLELHYDLHNRKCYMPGTINIYDLSENNNNATFIYPVYANDGIKDNMVYYDGTGNGEGTADGSRVDFNNYPAVSSNPSYAPNGRTIMWICKPEDTNRRGLIVGHSTINHLEQYNSTTFRTEARLQNGYSFGSNNCTITANKYDFWAIVFNNDSVNPTAKWYQNGYSFYEKTMINGNSQHDYFEPFHLGRETGTTSYHYAPSYKGFIPVFISYNATLSDFDILWNYNILKGRFGLI